MDKLFCRVNATRLVPTVRCHQIVRRTARAASIAAGVVSMIVFAALIAEAIASSGAVCWIFGTGALGAWTIVRIRHGKGRGTE